MVSYIPPSNNGNIDLKKVVFTALFAVLTAVGALIVIPVPFSPVPITLQTLFCMLSGAVLGKYRGMISQFFYIFMGVAGLPVFSGGGSSMVYLLGPTGGYIWGFAAGAYVSGFFRDKGRMVTGLIVATAVIYACGLLQLKLVTGLDFIKTFMVGALPFIPGDIIKIAAAAGIYRSLERAGMLEGLR